MHSRGASAVMLALTWAAVAFGPMPGPDALDLVIVRGGTTRTVALASDRGYPAAPAAALARALGYAMRGDAILLDGALVRFYEGSPFFSFGERVHQMPNAVYRKMGELMLPVSWALDWLPRARPSRWRNMDGRLVERSLATERSERRESWLVLIDPGHGGADPGAVGVNGTREKDVTLAIARRLKRRLERERGIEVVLTRDRDTLIALADRPRIPQIRGYRRSPDLFISIHANSMPRKPSDVRGFETYFLAVAKTEEARQVALRENAALRFESAAPVGPDDLDPLQFMLSDLQSTGNLRESSLLAASLDRSMAVTLQVRDLGVKQAGFWVLVGASMPAALVEVGYLSNRAEERMLRSSSYQAKIADALADGVVNYLAGYGRRIGSSFEAGG